MKYLLYTTLFVLLVACHSPQTINYEPTIITIDTDFSKGQLGLEHNITLQDLEKFHGHLCDGLVVGFLGLNEGLKILYPDGRIDRTNTRIVSGPSPCLTDVAVYVCGARYQFNTFYVDSTTHGIYTVQRIDNHKTVQVILNKGVKPANIDRLGKKAEVMELNMSELQHLKQLEDEFADYLLTTNPKNNFTVNEVKDFKWSPTLRNNFIKTDILNKNKSQ